VSTQLRLVGNGQSPSEGFCGMLGNHPSMLRLYDAIRRAAPLETPVLIEGPTGSGKELVARALHVLSGRPGAFVAVNVATLTEALADTELFGVARGAYTGAVTDRAGLIEGAREGTLVLDEAGDLAAPLQAKLLRVLESGVLRRVGEPTDRIVRFSLIVVVQRPATELVASGRWREDFYFRVAGIPLRVPSLAERSSDILRLVNHFLGDLGRPGLDPEGTAALEARSWPGNVRQLRRAVERAAFEADERAVTPDSILKAATALESPPDLRGAPTPLLSLREAEIQHINTVLRSTSFNVRRAAPVLGLSPSQLYRKLEALGIGLPQRR
jgi:DNA-binding NtrC family response regulator